MDLYSHILDYAIITDGNECNKAHWLLRVLAPLVKISEGGIDLVELDSNSLFEMPTLTNIAIPLIRRSPSLEYARAEKRENPEKPAGVSRTYSDGPLPIKPSEIAPRNARIVGRIAEDGGVAYRLKIGDVEIHDVGAGEILDYVSALELEQFENRRFEEEREVLRIVEAQAEDEFIRREEAKIERQKFRAKTKGTIIFEDLDESTAADTGNEGFVGRNGRARPSYKHLYMKFKEKRRRRKRNPITGELMPLDEDEDEDDENDDNNDSDMRMRQSSEDRGGAETKHNRNSVPAEDLPKRRRRKRDKITGELLPLSPVAGASTEAQTKRPRRRRHPETGELMPLGWIYDAENERRSTSETRTADPKPTDVWSEGRSPFPGGHLQKRRKLDLDFSSEDSSSDEATLRFQFRKEAPDAATRPVMKTTFGIEVIKLSDSDDSVEILKETKPPSASASIEIPAVPPLRNGSTFTKSAPLPKSSSKIHSSATIQSYFNSGNPSRSKPTSTTQELGSPSSVIRREKEVVSKPNVATFAGPSKPIPKIVGRDENDKVPLDEDEWFVEGILAHSWSDPKSHPPELGRDPVMLYEVKWDGYDKTTWEPEDSFEDAKLVRAYRRRVGLDGGASR